MIEVNTVEFVAALVSQIFVGWMLHQIWIAVRFRGDGICAYEKHLPHPRLRHCKDWHPAPPAPAPAAGREGEGE